MKLKVKRRFIDRHTGKVHERGECFTANKERLKEIQSVSTELVEVVQTKKVSDE